MERLYHILQLYQFIFIFLTIFLPVLCCLLFLYIKVFWRDQRLAIAALPWPELKCSTSPAPMRVSTHYGHLGMMGPHKAWVTIHICQYVNLLYVKAIVPVLIVYSHRGIVIWIPVTYSLIRLDRINIIKEKFICDELMRMNVLNL